MPNVGDIIRAADFQAIKPQLSIGTVTTGAAGTNASASISGTSPNFKLNLRIPRGNTGATGATGPQGPSGTYTGPLKPTSSYWREVSVSGTSWSNPLNLPTGGTWAWYLFSGEMALNTAVSVSAGGTLIGYAYRRTQNDSTKILNARALCWRIQ